MPARSDASAQLTANVLGVPHRATGILAADNVHVIDLAFRRGARWAEADLSRGVRRGPDQRHPR